MSSEAAPPAVISRDRLFTVPVILLWLAAHVALGVVGRLSPLVATAHAAVVAVLVLGLAFFGHRIDRLVAATAYGALGDVYWRMTSSRAPWEFSKYLLAVGAIAILFRVGRNWIRPGPPLVFLACLVPGLVMTVFALGLGPSRDKISLQEMGIISLALAVLAFRQLVASTTEAWNLGWVLLGPVVAVLAVTTYATLEASGITFTDESNFTVTGGFGPNQVSSILGLGILICVLLAFQRRSKQTLVILVGLGLWLTWAAFLTFSRGGVYSLVIAAGALLLVGVNTRGARVRSIVTLAVGVVGLMVMFASANDFSGSWLESRYSGNASGGGGRTTLADQDLQVFFGHPVWGVGTGQSSRYHTGGILTGASNHTEFTRILAEHGLLGLIILALLGSMVVSGFRHSRSQWNRLLVAAFSVWALTTMLHAATRLAAVGLVFALTQLRVEPDEPPSGPVTLGPGLTESVPILRAQAGVPG